MKNRFQPYAKYALLLAGLAALVTLALAAIVQEFSLPVQISLAVAVIALAASVLMDSASARRLLTGRQARYGSNALIRTLSVLGILVVLNLIAHNNTVRWDLTQDKTNTLAGETLDVLKALDAPVSAQAFFTSTSSRTSAETLLKNFKANARGNFDYEFIDPNENPVLANDAGITRDGSVLLRMGEAREIVTTVSEQEVTSALIRLKSPEKKVIYALTGHGELDLASTDGGFFYASNELKSKNYTINALNLLASSQIPADASALVIAGPLKPLSEAEVGVIKAYVESGGSLLVMYEPSVMTDFGDLPDPLAGYLAETWKVSFNDNMVIDLTADPVTTAVGVSYASHPITKDLERMATILPTARTVKIGEGASSGSALVSTSEQSWAEMDFEALKANKAEFNPDADTRGPLELMAALEDSTSGSRLLVVGDSEFASDNFYQFYGNADLFLNAVDWICGQDEIISLTTRYPTTRMLVTPNRYVQNALLLGVVVLLPLLILIAAVVVFVQRHREV